MADQEDEITLIDIILKIKEWMGWLKKSWWLLLLLGLIGAGIGGAWAWRTQKQYKATTIFSVQQGGGGSKLSGIASQFGFNLPSSSEGGVFLPQNLEFLIKSKKIIAGSLWQPYTDDSSRSYMDVFAVEEGWNEAWQKKNPPIQTSFPPTERSKSNRIQDSLVLWAAEEFVVKQLTTSWLSDESSLMQVDFVSSNEVVTASFNSLLVKQMLELYEKMKTDKDVRNLAEFDHKIDSVTIELESAMVRAADLQDRLTYTSESASQIPLAKAKLKIQTLTVLQAELIKNKELTSFTMQQYSPIIEFIDEPILPLETEEKSVIKYLTLGSILGGFLGAIWVIGRIELRSMMSTVD